MPRRSRSGASLRTSAAPWQRRPSRSGLRAKRLAVRLLERGRSERVAFVVSGTTIDTTRGVMPSLRCATTDPRPRLREKDPPALSAQQNSLLNTLRLLPAHLPKPHERRAPKLLHVGRRISVIQGRRAGEWLEQHRSASDGRDTARVRALRAAASTSYAEVDGGRHRAPRSGIV
jgi:hypothetical protein